MQVQYCCLVLARARPWSAVSSKSPLVLADPLLRQLTAFAQIQCTQKEASKVLGVSHRLLVQFLADHPEAREAWDRGRSLGHVSLRRLLWRQAQQNSAQARFLGKHWLGMDVKPRQAITVTSPSVLSDDENIARIHELMAEARRRSNRISDPKLPIRRLRLHAIGSCRAICRSHIG